MYLVFDTETSGLPISAVLNHPDQPFVVQIAAMLFDREFKVRGQFSALVDYGRLLPIHPKAEEKHGLTNDHLVEYGIGHSDVFNVFKQMLGKVEIAVAFNSDFDVKLLNIFAAKLGHSPLFTLKGTPALFRFLDSPTNLVFCPMKALTPVMKLPGKWPGAFKWPRLEEAHQFCFGRGFEGAHDAMADVQATARVFEWCVENRLVPNSAYCAPELDEVPV